MCMCALGGECSSFAAGHALPLIQARLAAATPSGWVDAVVDAGTPDSRDAASAVLTVRTLDGARTIRLWHAGTTGLVPGDPVAVHTVYGVLAAGGRRRSVALLA
jgi:hypothetical protein